MSNGLTYLKLLVSGLIMGNAHLSQSFYLQVATQIGILHGDMLKENTRNTLYLMTLCIM